MDDVGYADKVEAWQSRPEWRDEVYQVLGRLGVHPGMTVLDYGAASGATLEILEWMGCKAVGIETNPALVARHLWRETEAEIYPSLSEMLYHGNYPAFDVVLASHVLGHVESPRTVCFNLYSLLKVDGRVAVVVPNVIYDRLMIPANLFTGYRSDPTLRRELSLHSLKALFPAAASEPTDVFYLGDKPSWLPGRLLGDKTRSRMGAVFTRKPL
jgi:2-polyprenyl-3-methyl-5-hydroxy-6-metoxy-1,4-benzoquinol methylase